MEEIFTTYNENYFSTFTASNHDTITTVPCNVIDFKNIEVDCLALTYGAMVTM